MNIIKKSLSILGIVCLIMFFSVFTSHAQSIPSFGGLEEFAVPCTCMGGALAWHFFVPLYLNSSVPIAGGLTGPWVTGFANYSLHPGAYALGKLIPGPPCMIGVPPYCYALPHAGTISPFTGTSLVL